MPVSLGSGKVAEVSLGKGIFAQIHKAGLSSSIRLGWQTTGAGVTIWWRSVVCDVFTRAEGTRRTAARRRKIAARRQG